MQNKEESLVNRAFYTEIGENNHSFSQPKIK